MTDALAVTENTGIHLPYGPGAVSIADFADILVSLPREFIDLLH